MASVKLVIIDPRALSRKYGASGLQRIERALRLVAGADTARGLTTETLRVDARGDARIVKRAIDAAWRRARPDYGVLIGAPDAMPQVGLRNPFAAADDDPDPDVPSDLPYACGNGYGLSIERFVGPTRVVGRLPDVAGASEPSFLLELLERLRAWRPRARRDYDSCFALTARVWRRSTRSSVKRLLGRTALVHDAPPRGPRWSARELAHRLFFINCHGAPADPMFYGEADDVQTDALVSTELIGAVRRGAVAAAECCYGADLYDPVAFGVEPGVCSRFLLEGGHGWFGSTTVAYGPEAGNGYADLICRFFLECVREGASIGRAALEARLRYVATGAPLDPTDLKTLAQFVLLGDPSVQPVAAPVGGKAPKRVDRAVRRRMLAVRGTALGRLVARAESRLDGTPTRRTGQALDREAREHGLEPHQVLTYALRPGLSAGETAAVAKAARVRLAPAQTRTSGVYHVIFARPARMQPSIMNASMLVVREEEGALRTVAKAVQRG